MNLAVLVFLGPLIYVAGRFLQWFLQPAFVGERNEKIIKEYKFTNPNNVNKQTQFDTIEDKPTKSMSIVVPAYNEENRIRSMLDSTIKYLENRRKESNSKSKHEFDWEIIVVNDGSSDNTCNIILTEYCKKYGTDFIRLLSYDKNQGKGYAVQQVSIVATYSSIYIVILSRHTTAKSLDW